ncbi:PQQ-binding-like beta-propeller repeat protein [Deinococcus detaillensis]|uniref:PQQ-binding-like beta-propeller repeat protein n=2 Tax=Deinococcus detaillensis TaxID=2592048 RepID=A0A553UHS9_9DEIO|nr:PQQ-binding-like beta-propeller repeat protein [Deinococcus detaillensis]
MGQRSGSDCAGTRSGLSQRGHGSCPRHAQPTGGHQGRRKRPRPYQHLQRPLGAGRRCVRASGWGRTMTRFQLRRWLPRLGGLVGSLALAAALIGAQSGTPVTGAGGVPKILWTVNGQGWAGASVVLASGGQAFVADARGIASGLDALSGKQHWRFDLGDRLLYTPAISGQTLLLARVGELAAVSLDGKTRWEKHIDDSPVLSPAVGKNGTIYAAGGPFLYALDGQGKEIWQHKVSTFYSASPVVAQDGTVYIGAKSLLLALTPQGKVKWQYKAASTLYANPAIDGQGNLYLGTGSGLVSLNPAGKVRWTHKGAPLETTPLIGKENRLYLTDTAGQLTAMSLSGDVSWTVQVGESIGGSSALARDVIYVGTGDGLLHALNLDGQQQWALQLDGAVFGSPVIGPDGHLYVGAGRTFYALATSSPLATAPWPLARQNAAGQGRAP